MLRVKFPNDQNTGFAVGKGNGLYFKTTDAGANWTSERLYSQQEFYGFDTTPGGTFLFFGGLKGSIVQVAGLSDVTPPGTVSGLTDGGTTQTSTSELTASWTAASDAESGIGGYVVSVGTTAGGSDVVASQSVGLTTSVSLTGLSLTVGQTYYTSVAAVNGAGLTGSALSTDGIQVVSPPDVTPPDCRMRKGDVNGDCRITVEDQMMVMDFLTETRTLSKDEAYRAIVHEETGQAKPFPTIDDASLIGRCVDKQISAQGGYLWCD